MRSVEITTTEDIGVLVFRGKYQLDALCNILHNDTSNVYLHGEDLPVCLIKHCACSRGAESFAGTHPGCKHSSRQPGK